MKDKFKSTLLTSLILVIIGILLFFNYYYFKLSPTMLYNQKDKEVLQLFEENNELSDLRLESRYVFDEIYYTASDQTFIYFFLDNGKLVLTVEKNDLDYDRVLDIANSMFTNLENNVYLSVYNQKAVYVIVNSDYDVFIDYLNFEEVFRFRKGIGNE